MLQDRPLRSNFDVVLEVAGEYYDVVRASGDFALNQIPHAVCMLAVGRDAMTGQIPAKIHSKFEEFANTKNVAKLWFCPSGEWSQEYDWPEGPHLLFEGRIVGIGLQRQDRNFQLVAYLEHWLGDLNFSSCMCEQSHPANISDYVFCATVGPSMQSSGEKLYAIAATAEGAAITATSIKEDLWGEVLKPFFCALAEAKTLKFDPKLTPCGTLEKQDNSQSIAALSRMEGVSQYVELAKKYNRERSCFTPKLALRSDETRELPQQVATGIADFISKQAVKTFENSTLWGKLVAEYSPELQFAVVPLVDTALVVPVTPGLRLYWCKRIVACDYSSLSYQAEIVRPIRAVAVFCGTSFRSNAQSNQSTGSVSGYIGCGGCWSPDDEEAKPGMVLTHTLPVWLNSMVAASKDSKRTTGAGGHYRASTLVPREEPDPDAAARPDGATDEKVILEASDMCVGFAHSKYVSEILRGRNATLTGKLRFDIAPGSTVWVEGTSERFIAKDNDKLAHNLVGLVVRVSFGLDAETGKAGTAFTLAYVRTEKENESDNASVECHPMYATRFLGAPLVEALWLPDEGDECCSGGGSDPNLNCA